MRPFKINHRVQISSLVLFDTAAFTGMFNSLDFRVERISQFGETAAVPVAKNILQRMKVKVSRRKSAMEELQLLNGEKLALGELDTVQIRRALKSYLLSHNSVMMDGLIAELFLHVARQRNLLFTLRTSALFLQLVSTTVRRKRR